jgi:hypothetical protein
VAGSGDLGPNWSSAIGGGLGRRGELDGEIGVAVIVVVNECEGRGRRVSSEVLWFVVRWQGSEVKQGGRSTPR